MGAHELQECCHCPGAPASKVQSLLSKAVLAWVKSLKLQSVTAGGMSHPSQSPPVALSLYATTGSDHTVAPVCALSQGQVRDEFLQRCGTTMTAINQLRKGARSLQSSEVCIGSGRHGKRACRRASGHGARAQTEVVNPALFRAWLAGQALSQPSVRNFPSAPVLRACLISFTGGSRKPASKICCQLHPTSPTHSQRCIDRPLLDCTAWAFLRMRGQLCWSRADLTIL